MDRLHLISQLDPVWYQTIENFLVQNPEFGPYAYLVPIQRPIQNKILKPKYFIEHLLRYVCEAGVNRNYAHQQYNLIVDFLHKYDFNMELMVAALYEKLQPKKRQVYLDIWERVKLKGPLNYTLDDLMQTKIPGVGAGCIGHLKQFWSTDDHAVEITDRGFVAGFTKIYGLAKNAKPSEIKNKVNSWGNEKIVGSLLCTQVYHYILDK
jgi:hypothetical protein